MPRRLPLLALLSFSMIACGGEDATSAPPQAPAPPPAPTAIAATPTAAPTAPPETPAPAAPSLADVQKKTIAAYVDAFNAHDTTKLGPLYTADAVVGTSGEEGWKEIPAAQDVEGSKAWFAAFPDVKLVATRVFQRPEIVVVEWIAVGTNTGPIFGKDATGKKAGVKGLDAFWIDPSGAIKRQEAYWDRATVMQQIGLAPGQPRAIPDLPSGEPTWVVAKGTPDEDKLVEQVKGSNWPAAFTKHDRKMYEGNVKDDSAHYEIASPMDAKGKGALMKEYDMLTKAMPDVSAKIDGGWAFDKYVLLKFTFGGTLKGPFGPFKPTGKNLTIHGFDVDEMNADGTYQNAWSYSNGMEILAQVGALKPPPAAKPAAKTAEKKGEPKPKK